MVVWVGPWRTRAHVPPLAHIPGLATALVPAMAHGFFYEERQRPERSSPIFADEVRDTGWDYVALGHHHVRADVSQGAVAAYYAGAPMAEWGDGPSEGTALQIHLSDDGGICVEPRRLR